MLNVWSLTPPSRRIAARRLSLKKRRIQEHWTKPRRSVTKWNGTSTCGGQIGTTRYADSPVGPDALPEEAESLLERIDELEHNLDQREALGRRSFGIERDAEKFGDKVNALVSECATDLVELRTALAAEQLIQRFHEGQVERTRRDALDRELAERREELQDLELRERNAVGTLERLIATARCKNGGVPGGIGTRLGSGA